MQMDREKDFTWQLSQQGTLMSPAKSMRSKPIDAAQGIKLAAGTGSSAPKSKETGAHAPSATPVDDLQLLLYATGYYDQVADAETEALGRMLSNSRVSCTEHRR
jgi:hypothetical protein